MAGFDLVYDGAVRLRPEVLVIDALLTFLGLAMVRVGVRGLRHALRIQRVELGTRVLLYGAGDAGLLLLRELRQNPDRALTPVGFLDDDPLKQGMSVQGVRVLGGVDDIAAACEHSRATTVVLTAPHRFSAERRRHIEAACALAGARCHHFSILLGPDAAYFHEIDARDGASASFLRT